MSGRPRVLNAAPAGFTPLAKVDIHSLPEDLGGDPDGVAPPGTVERLAILQARARRGMERHEARENKPLDISLPLPEPLFEPIESVRREVAAGREVTSLWDGQPWPAIEEPQEPKPMKTHPERAKGLEIISRTGAGAGLSELRAALSAVGIKVADPTIYSWRAQVFTDAMPSSRKPKPETNGHTRPPLERRDGSHETPPAPRIKLDARQPTKTQVYSADESLAAVIELLQTVQRLGGVVAVKRKLKLLEELAA